MYRKPDFDRIFDIYFVLLQSLNFKMDNVRFSFKTLEKFFISMVSVLSSFLYDLCKKLEIGNVIKLIEKVSIDDECDFEYEF